MEINAVVSENARRLREEKRLTLDEAARLTGVSRSMLAQIEKGDVNPTISMVWKIANGYKVNCWGPDSGKPDGTSKATYPCCCGAMTRRFWRRMGGGTGTARPSPLTGSGGSRPIGS